MLFKYIIQYSSSSDIKIIYPKFIIKAESEDAAIVRFTKETKNCQIITIHKNESV